MPLPSLSDMLAMTESRGIAYQETLHKAKLLDQRLEVLESRDPAFPPSHQNLLNKVRIELDWTILQLQSMHLTPRTQGDYTTVLTPDRRQWNKYKRVIEERLGKVEGMVGALEA